MELAVNTEAELENYNIPINTERAKFSDRFFANMVDGIIVNTPLRLMNLALAMVFKSVYFPLFYLLLELGVFIWYFSYFPYKHNGQTLGKKWLKIRITRLDGQNPTFGNFIFRDAIKNGMVVLISIFFGFWGLLWVLTYLLALTKDRQALHDIIARTQVIKIK